jgi:hypothetical protein
MELSIYVFRNHVFIPTVAKTQAGYHLEIEPVEHLSLTSPELPQVLGEVLKRGNPEVPTPSRANFPKPWMLKYRSAKSWKKFSEIADLWSLTEHQGTYMLARASNDPITGAYWCGKNKIIIPSDTTSGGPNTRAIVDAILSETSARRGETRP